MSLALAGLALVSLLGVTGCLGPVTKYNKNEAVRLPETSDPAVVVVGDTYYIYGSNNHLRAPVTITKDIDRVYSLQAKNARTREAMPSKPAWVKSSTQFWAPSVAKFGNRWVMFFSADRVNPPQPHNAQCIGRAFASSPAGPFQPESSPFHCGLGGVGGALDPEVFVDRFGGKFLLMAFGDTEAPIHSMPLRGDSSIAGAPRAILARQHPWEYHFIEQPSMIFDNSRGDYVLTYSAGKWWEAKYGTGIARCATPLGPCSSDPTGAWIYSGNGRTGPGGLSFFRDSGGAPRAVFSSFAAGHESTNGGRSASILHVKFQPSMHLTVVK